MTDPLADLDRGNLALAMRAEVAEIAARRPDIAKGCDACRVLGPLLTASGTSGRTWVCECGAAWSPDRPTDVAPIPPVVVTIPADLCSEDLEVLVRHEDGEVFVDVRGDSRSSWTPICMTGGSFEVRSA